MDQTRFNADECLLSDCRSLSFVRTVCIVFYGFYIETAIATAICLLSLLESFRVFGQFKADYIEKVIENDTVKEITEKEPDDFAPYPSAKFIFSLNQWALMKRTKN